jgi:hypothetical protein
MNVFLSEEQPKHRLILLGSSHLKRIAGYLDTDKFEVVDLCKSGFRITESSVKELVAMLETEMASMETPERVVDRCTIIIQLFDNTVYQVGGPGGGYATY